MCRKQFLELKLQSLLYETLKLKLRDEKISNRAWALRMKYLFQSSSFQNVFSVMELKLSECLFCNGAQALNVKNPLRSSSSWLIKLGQNHLGSNESTLRQPQRFRNSKKVLFLILKMRCVIIKLIWVLFRPKRNVLAPVPTPLCWKHPVIFFFTFLSPSLLNRNLTAIRKVNLIPTVRNFGKLLLYYHNEISISRLFYCCML